MQSSPSLDQKRVAEQAYTLFQKAAEAFERASTNLERSSSASDGWRASALRQESTLLKKQFDELTKLAAHKLSALSSQPIPTDTLPPILKTADDTPDLAVMGGTLDVMRENYTVLRQTQERLVGPYKAPPRRVAFPTVLVSWVIFLLLVLLLFMTILLPVGQFIGRVIAYTNAAQAYDAGNWEAAINDFTYAYETGPHLDSELRLVSTYQQALQASLGAQDWETTRRFSTRLLDLGIADTLAQQSLRDSYALPARAAYEQSNYGEARALLDAGPQPLDGSAEMLYKRSLLDEAQALANRGDWESVESLLVALSNRPEGASADSIQLVNVGRNLLSVSYTERAGALISSGDWDEARALLQPALTVPLTTVQNSGNAQRLLRESYYVQGETLLAEGRYEEAREQFVTILEFNDDSVYRSTPEQYRLTFYLPAMEALNADDYETARGLFTQLIALDSPDPAFRDSRERFLDTFLDPARAINTQETPTLTDFEEARALLEAMFEADGNSRTYSDARQQYWNTFYLPAIDFLSEAEPNFGTARSLLEQMFDTDIESRDYQDAEIRYYSTFYQPAMLLFGGNPEEDIAPDYLGARGIFEEMFAAAPDSVDYVDSQDRYRDTFYNLALPLLEGDGEADFVPDYQGARDILAEMFAADAESVDYLDSRNLYLSTFYDPAIALLEAEEPDYPTAQALLRTIMDFDETSQEYRGDARNRYFETFYAPAAALLPAAPTDDIAVYQEARPIFEAIIAQDERIREYRDTEALYWDTIYYPAIALFDERDFLGARAEFQTIIDDGGARHLRTETYFLNTYWLRGRDFRLGNNQNDIAIDYDRARAEFQFILDYTPVVVEPDFRNSIFEYAETYYVPGRAARDDEAYDDARAEFGQLLAYLDANDYPPHKDTVTRYQDTFILPAEALIDEQRYVDARGPLNALLESEYLTPDYRTRASELRVLTYTLPAQEFEAAGELEQARDMLEALYVIDTSAETVERLRNIYVRLIQSAIDEDAFDQAQVYLRRINEVDPDYRLGEELLLDFLYQQAVSAAEQQNWVEARRLLEGLVGSDYQDSRTRLFDTYYLPAAADLQAGREQGRGQLCAAAREQLQLLIELLPSDTDFRDTRTLLNQTYLCEIDLAIADDDMVSARQSIAALLSVSPFYGDIEERLIRTYYDPAEVAFDEGRYEDARRLLTELITTSDTFFFEEAFLLLRETYYVPGIQAFEVSDWTTAREELADLLAIDPNYKDAADRYRDAFSIPAQQAFDAQNWSVVRNETRALLSTIDNNDEAARVLLLDSYFEPARLAAEVGDWVTVQRELDGLANIDIRHRLEEWLPLRLEAFYQPARAQFDTALVSNSEADWSRARTLLQALADDLDQLRTLASTEPLLAEALDLRDLLDEDSEYLDRDVLFYNTYLVPGLNAINSGNWASARALLSDLAETNPDYEDTAYTETPVPELYVDSYLRPGLAAFAAQDWANAREALRAIVYEVREFATDEQFARARENLLNTYLVPAQIAAEGRDWATARFNRQQLLEDEAELLTEEEQAQYVGLVRETYTLPIEQALAGKAYDAARRALQDFATAYSAETAFYDTQLRATYEIPLREAIAIEDWYSAAEHYMAMRAIVPATDPGLYTLFMEQPALRLALANRAENYWLTSNFTQAAPAALSPMLDEETGVLDVAFNSTGTRLATAHTDGTIHIWDVRSPDAEAFAIVTDARWLRNVEWEPAAGVWLAASGDDERVMIFDGASGQLLAELSDMSAPVTTLSISTDGSRLAAGSEDGTLLIWDASDWAAAPVERSFDAAVSTMAFAPDALALALADLRIVVTEPSDGQTTAEWTTDAYVSQILFSPDGETLLTLDFAGNIERWSQGGALLDTLHGHGDWLRAGTFLANGRILATLDASGEIRLWNSTDWSFIRALPSATITLPTHLLFAPDGHTLVITSPNEGAGVWTASVESFLTEGQNE